MRPERDPATVEVRSGAARPASLAAARSCGSCRVCCRLPDIPEINKPLDTWCPDANIAGDGPGCSRYETRPQVCRGFSCGWLDGLGERRDRPDRLGIMWQPIELPGGRPGIGFVEVRPRALEEPRVVRYLQKFAELKPGQVFIRRANTPRMETVPLSIGGRSVGGGTAPGFEPAEPLVGARRGVAAAHLAAASGRTTRRC